MFHRLIMFYKIIHSEVPSYWAELIPPRVGDVNKYNLRNRNHFSTYQSRTDSFNRTIFPSTVREWNQLPINIKESTSLGILKVNFNPNYSQRKLNPGFTMVIQDSATFITAVSEINAVL
jgi:hypothetical protein